VHRLDVVRAWKDEQYRLGLSDAERASLPANPVGMIELGDADLGGVAGAGVATTEQMLTMGCCYGLTQLSCWCSVGCTFTWMTICTYPCTWE
jgi:mersacidin/lichenicidin family type 2 lantibiotic